jgi:hypothetical protein
MIDFPVGSIIASDREVYLKKQTGTKPYDYEEYWIGAEGFAFPVYTDRMANNLVTSGNFKVLRMGTSE